MKQEENLKQLLLKELSSRLPYNVVVNYKGLARPLFGIEPTQHFQITLDRALDGEHNGLVYVSLDVDGEVPKPYLRPMSSMTEEEMDKLAEFHIWNDGEKIFPDCNCKLSDIVSAMNWLSKKMFDYRGLIEKGLAIEAPSGMY